MADMISDDQLREMAAYRLLKLVKPKLSKPGLATTEIRSDGRAWEELPGFSAHGLTASAQEHGGAPRLRCVQEFSHPVYLINRPIISKPAPRHAGNSRLECPLARRHHTPAPSESVLRGIVQWSLARRALERPLVLVAGRRARQDRGLAAGL